MPGCSLRRVSRRPSPPDPLPGGAGGRLRTASPSGRAAPSTSVARGRPHTRRPRVAACPPAPSLAASADGADALRSRLRPPEQSGAVRFRTTRLKPAQMLARLGAHNGRRDPVERQQTKCSPVPLRQAGHGRSLAVARRTNSRHSASAASPRRWSSSDGVSATSANCFPGLLAVTMADFGGSSTEVLASGRLSTRSGSTTASALPRFRTIVGASSATDFRFLGCL